MMINHTHPHWTECYEMAQFSRLKDNFEDMMKNFPTHEDGDYNTCNDGPHPDVDCFVADLEKLHSKLLKYIWHDQQKCASSCTERNHTNLTTYNRLYPVLE